MKLRALKKVQYLVIHYSATPIERRTSLRDIDRMHRRRGFEKIGYHAYGRRSGGYQEGRKVFKNGTFEQGAQSFGENAISLGYCYEGGVSVKDVNKGFDTRTPAQIEAMTKWIDEMLALTGGDGVDPRKGPIVIGHRNMPGAATQCPGFDAGAWWKSVVANRPARRALPWWLRIINSLFKGGEK